MTSDEFSIFDHRQNFFQRNFGGSRVEEQNISLFYGLVHRCPFLGTRSKKRGLAGSACRLRCSLEGCPWRTPVSCQELQISTSSKMLALVEEYKQLVLAQPSLMPLKTEERNLCRIQISHTEVEGVHTAIQ